jgi:hypothetical protein
LYVTAFLVKRSVPKRDQRNGWKHLLDAPPNDAEDDEDAFGDVGHKDEGYDQLHYLYPSLENPRHDFTKWQLLFPNLISLKLILAFVEPHDFKDEENWKSLSRSFGPFVKALKRRRVLLRAQNVEVHVYGLDYEWKTEEGQPGKRCNEIVEDTMKAMIAQSQGEKTDVKGRKGKRRRH